MFIDRCSAAKHNVSTRRWVPHGYLWTLIGLSLLTANPVAVAQSMGPPVAVASSLRALWPNLMDAWQADTDLPNPRASFASSGLLSTQIRFGAPFELFLSADLDTVERLLHAGKTRDTGVGIARGDLSLVARKPDKPDNTVTWQTLNDAMEQSASLKLAMPNPRHAPYGQAARQALISISLWPLPPGRLLSAENAAQSLQYALSGAATFAIVPTTLVTPSPADLHVEPVPATHYESIDHRAVLMLTASQPAEVFMTWLQTPPAQDVLQQFGLSPGLAR